MDDRLEHLLDKAKGLPKAPGVYLMKDSKGRVIYVGKSASLRDRVCSYFQPATKLESKKAPLRDVVVDFDFIQTESEVEALLAENRLIKDIQPKYNARLLDDKTFPYLMVTTDEDFPGVYVTREPRMKGVKLYGPFTSVGQLKEAVTLLQKAFKFRTCHLEILEGDDKRRFFRPCLLYAINQCTAPCAAKIPKDSYAEDVGRLLRFLEGNHKQVMRELEKEMIEASKDQRFERAAKLRDEIKALQGLNARGKKGDQEYWQPEAFIMDPKEGVTALQNSLALAEPPRIIEGIDIAHLQGGEMVGSKVCFIDGVPFKDGYRKYKIKHEQGNNDYLSIQEVVSRRYREAGSNNELFPDVILIDGGLGQLHAALDVFKQMDVKPPMVISLAKKEELVFVQAKSEPLKLARNDAGLKMLQYIRDEAHRFAQHYHHILRRKSQLEEDVKQGRRPPVRRKYKKDPAAIEKEKMLTTPQEMPHSSHAVLPILQPKVEPQIEAAPMDAEDAADQPPVNGDIDPQSPQTAPRMAAPNPIQLGIAHQQAGRLAEARAIYDEVLAREPRHADALHLLGIISVQEGNLEAGISLFTQAIESAPHVVEYRLSLINACLDAGRAVEAIEHCKQAIEVGRIRSLPQFNADLADVLLQVGNAFLQNGDRAHGMDALAAAASIRPPIAAAFNDFGAALRDIGRLDESVEVLRGGLEVAPAMSEIHNNLGNTLKDQGKPDEAIVAFREAIRLQPTNATAHQNLLFAMHLSPAIAAEVIAAEHRAWGERHADPLTRAARPHAKASSRERLRIGYISPDFRDHPVGRFLLPAISHHDRGAFDIVCYSNWSGPADALTQRFAARAGARRDVARLDDEQLAGQIRADGIDILIDVAGHSVGNRLGTFARKPAPVQITWLGYPDTTGMSAMDWRITDAHADPPGMTEALHVEQLIRLPRTAWCLEPPADAPPTTRDANDRITFGSFNSLSKLNDDLLRIWAKLLKQTPGARMLIKGVGLAGEQTRGRVLKTFAACGIDPARIELLTPKKSFTDHLALYHRIDVALDAYPYHGTTTTCEALWMGVPVVTLAGRTHVSRVGVSLLSNVGLDEMIATTQDQYISIAVALAGDVAKRNELRSTLRDRMRSSPLMDARQFARDIEEAYRFAWSQSA